MEMVVWCREKRVAMGMWKMKWVNGYRNVERMSDGEHVNGYGRYGMGCGMWWEKWWYRVSWRWWHTWDKKMGMHGREVEEMDEDLSAWWIEKEWRLGIERNGDVRWPCMHEDKQERKRTRKWMEKMNERSIEGNGFNR